MKLTSTLPTVSSRCNVRHEIPTWYTPNTFVFWNLQQQRLFLPNCKMFHPLAISRYKLILLRLGDRSVHKRRHIFFLQLKGCRFAA